LLPLPRSHREEQPLEHAGAIPHRPKPHPPTSAPPLATLSRLAATVQDLDSVTTGEALATQPRGKHGLELIRSDGLVGYAPRRSVCQSAGHVGERRVQHQEGPLMPEPDDADEPVVEPARVNGSEADLVGNHCVVAESSLGSLIHTAVGSAGGWGGLRTKRSGCSAWAALRTPARLSRTATAGP
jgi:hypothetical protein